MYVHFIGDKLNELLKKISSSMQYTSQSIAFNSPQMKFDFTMYLLQIIGCLNSFNASDTDIAQKIRNLYDEEVNGVLKRGYLVKKGGKRKNWRKRWFVLKSDAICYYESKENLTLKVCAILTYMCLHTCTGVFNNIPVLSYYRDIKCHD